MRSLYWTSEATRRQKADKETKEGKLELKINFLTDEAGNVGSLQIKLYNRMGELYAAKNALTVEKAAVKSGYQKKADCSCSWELLQLHLIWRRGWFTIFPNLCVLAAHDWWACKRRVITMVLTLHWEMHICEMNVLGGFVSLLESMASSLTSGNEIMPKNVGAAPLYHKTAASG